MTELRSEPVPSIRGVVGVLEWSCARLRHELLAFNLSDRGRMRREHHLAVFLALLELAQR